MPDDITKREIDILAFWKEREVFRRSVERDAPHGEFVFFEGPPTANAPPGIHHVEGRTFKDIIPRYKTMRGYRVRRKAGWDTHGLPVELQIEKKLGLKTKKDIEQYGIAAFNAACRDSVWAFKKEWEHLTERIGFWLDQDDPYITYDMPYVESVWWFLKQAWEKQLLTRDYKVVPWCPRCETPLSSHEVAQGYEETEDPSVYVKFEISNLKFEIPENASAYFLVWTTTPWTLPGNGALAVHPGGEYAVVRNGDERLILAAPCVARVFGDDAVIERTVSGKDLLTLRYEPPYPQIDTVAYPKAYQVFDADFVSFDDGTGIVHIAPAYGEDDFLFKQRGVPVAFSVDERGIMGDGLPGAGKFAKQADADIRADLATRGLLFRDETIRHTYPFCWRCKTPLLYFARASWYITMSKLRSQLQERNAEVQWHPSHIGAGRMGEWLKEAKDWAITRERFWGTPLPTWECSGFSPSRREGELEGVGCGRTEVIGSFAELLARSPKRNRFFAMRHGRATSNTDGPLTGVISSRLDTSGKYPLTNEGRAKAAIAAAQLKDQGITKIICSPFARTRETAQIIADALGVSLVEDARLREIDIPDFDGKSTAEHRGHFTDGLERFTKEIGTNETWDALARRMMNVVADIDRTHDDATILLVSHGDPLFLLRWALSGFTRHGIEQLDYPQFAEPFEFPFTAALVNDRGELDVHRPFVDGMMWPCATDGCTGTMRRFPEVVDVWMDSGCMPFAQVHFPFETGNGISPPEADAPQTEKSLLQRRIRLRRKISNLPVLYPASYISEAIDQTRGWFYTLLAVATVLDWPAPYQHAICYSHILDQHGKKMSKSKGNVVNPQVMIEKYGADVVRWYMVTVNQPGDTKLFDEQDLLRMSRKPFGTLLNVLEFWKLHGGNAKAQWFSPSRREGEREGVGSGTLLDSWLRARFASLHHDVTQHLDAYEITDAARALESAINDLSTWWLRRSRERLRGRGESGSSPLQEGELEGVGSDQLRAQQTFTAALETLAVLLAPFAPFTAEHVWGVLRAFSPSVVGGGDQEGVVCDSETISVHLAHWDAFAPPGAETDPQLLTDMDTVRRICSLGLEARAIANVPIRQPLTKLSVRPSVFSPSRREGEPEGVGSVFHSLIADELNVREVVIDASLPTDVHLDTTLTPTLQREGIARDLIRKVNGLRKELSLTPSDRIRVVYTTDDTTLTQAIEEHHGEIERGTMSVLSPSSRGGVGGGAEAEATHHTLTISGISVALDIAREV